MAAEQTPLDELDQLILEALKEKPERELSMNFTDTLLRKVEKRLWWRELIQAFAMKIAIVAGTLGIILIIMIFLASEASSPFLLMLKNNWQLVTGVVFLILFTFFSDQVVLKYFTASPKPPLYPQTP